MGEDESAEVLVLLEEPDDLEAKSCFTLACLRRFGRRAMRRAAHAEERLLDTQREVMRHCEEETRLRAQCSEAVVRAVKSEAKLSRLVCQLTRAFGMASVEEVIAAAPGYHQLNARIAALQEALVLSKVASRAPFELVAPSVARPPASGDVCRRMVEAEALVAVLRGQLSAVERNCVERVSEARRRLSQIAEVGRRLEQSGGGSIRARVGALLLLLSDASSRDEEVVAAVQAVSELGGEEAVPSAELVQALAAAAEADRVLLELTAREREVEESKCIVRRLEERVQGLEDRVAELSAGKAGERRGIRSTRPARG